jgi:hypothetical protein
MSTDSNSNSADLPAKQMKRKYDGRKNNGRYKSAVKRGPKPKWMQHLSRNMADKLLREFDSIASPAEIYAWCWEHKKVELMVGMRDYVWNRLEGRPFVAENPEKTTRPDTLAQDSRLQDAIKKLVPKAQPVKTVM